ncbi:MAG: ribonuclease [Verrucomicrobiaceae bacterium]|nr:ribonuclease [Verrucomicrobiaceae bacterium]
MSGLNAQIKLYRSLGYRFTDSTLIEQALTHRSFGGTHNERLEFLGDAIVNLIVAEALFAQFPTTREGDLTRMRATLIRGVTLAEIARELQLGDFLKLGSGEMKSGGHRRESILADVLEAIIAAIYLDGGIDICRERVLAWFGQRLQAVAPGEATKDPKTRLQEWLQGRAKALPVYVLTDTQGEAHNQHFAIECRIPSIAEHFPGSGSSRRIAEQEAAQAALDFLEQHKSEQHKHD